MNTDYIGMTCFKRSGKTFGNGTSLDTIVGIVEHPHISGEAYLTGGGSYLTDSQTVIVLSEGGLFAYKGETYNAWDILMQDRSLVAEFLVDIAMRYARIIDPGMVIPNVVETKPLKQQTRESIATTRAMEYQHRICGKQERLIEAGGESHWADGVLDRWIIEAKYVEDETNEAYCGTAKNKAEQKHVIENITKQIERILRIVNHPEQKYYEGVIIITNSRKAVEYLCSVLPSSVRFQVIK